MTKRMTNDKPDSDRRNELMGELINPSTSVGRVLEVMACLMWREVLGNPNFACPPSGIPRAREVFDPSILDEIEQAAETDDELNKLLTEARKTIQRLLPGDKWVLTLDRVHDKQTGDLTPVMAEWCDDSNADPPRLDEHPTAYIEAELRLFASSSQLHRAYLTERLSPGIAERPIRIGKGHPFYLIVYYHLLKRTRPASIDLRDSGIVPSPALTKISIGGLLVPDRESVKDGILQARPDRPWVEDMAARLPGTRIAKEGEVPAILVALHDAGICVGRGGMGIEPILLLELLMAPERSARSLEGYVSLSGLTIRDCVRLVGWNPRNYRPRRHDSGDVLSRALKRIDSIVMPYGDGGWAHPVRIDDIEGRRLDHRVSARVLSLRNSDKGSLLSRDLVRQVAVSSPVGLRMLMAFHAEFNRIAKNGKVPHYLQPEYRRNEDGAYIDANGEVIKHRGTPVRAGRPPRRAVKTGEMVPSRNANLHKTYAEPGDLVAFGWPFVPPRQTTVAVRKAVATARWLAGDRDVEIGHKPLGDPAISIIRDKTSRGNPDGFPWRVEPFRKRRERR